MALTRVNGAVVGEDVPRYFPTAAEAKADGGLKVGQRVRIGDRGDSLWDVIAATGTENEYDVLANAESGVSLQILVGDELNIVTLGADPTNTTDSEPHISRAIEMAFDNGYTIYIPAGTYRTDATITVSRDGFKDTAIRIRGHAYRSILRPTISSGYALVFDGDTKEQPVYIDGLTLNGAATTGTADGVIFHRTMGSCVKDIYVHSFARDNIIISEGWNQTYINLESRVAAGTGLKLETDATFSTTTSEINNITFIGGTSSLNDVGVKISSSGSATNTESIKFYGFNTSNVSNGWVIYNCDESSFDTIYLEQDATAAHQVEMYDCNGCEWRVPHVTANKNVFYIQDSVSIDISKMYQQSALGASDILVEVQDSRVKFEGCNVTGGALGTFLKATQTGTNNLQIQLEDNRIVSFATLLDETFNDTNRVRVRMEGNEGLEFTDWTGNIKLSGTDREGYLYTKPNSNSLAKIGSSSTVGATETAWIEVDIGGTIAYIRAYATK